MKRHPRPRRTRKQKMAWQWRFYQHGFKPNIYKPLWGPVGCRRVDSVMLCNPFRCWWTDTVGDRIDLPQDFPDRFSRRLRKTYRAYQHRI